MKELTNPFQGISEQNEAILRKLDSLEDLLEKKEVNKKEPTRMLTRNEVCDHLKISKGTLHKLMRENLLAYRKIGRKTLFEFDVVENFFSK